MIMKSGGEPAILTLKEAVTADAAAIIEVEGRKKRHETVPHIIPEQSAANDSQPNGKIERFIQEIQRQIRTLKDAIESKLNELIHDDH